MPSIRSVLTFLTLSLALYNPAFGQETPEEQAKAYMEQAKLMLEASQAYDDIRDIVVLAADLDTSSLLANYQAGYLYSITKNKDLGVKYFLRVYNQDPGYKYDIEYRIGKAYQFGHEFDKAIEYYNLYKEKLGKKAYQGKDKFTLAETERAIYECENGKEFLANPRNHSIVTIGEEINSSFDDYAPVLNEAEDEIVFTTRRFHYCSHQYTPLFF